MTCGWAGAQLSLAKFGSIALSCMGEDWTVAVQASSRLAQSLEVFIIENHAMCAPALRLRSPILYLPSVP
jgi:hypothetical protein